MKIQGLAVLAIVIILPMAILLNSYSSNQVKTLDLQISYDARLKSATYDGIKAFQLNMSNSTTSEISDSKMRDIKASINTFYNSLASQFGMSGYGEDVLQNYVPAIVYTLYDGYYIYSAYNNKLDSDDNFYADATYKADEILYGLKPYIYYSCRYKSSAYDVVITYSLDSYITIQGTIGGNSVNESGYLLSGVSSNGSRYRGIEILEEQNKSGLEQNVYLPEETDTSSGRPIYVEDISGTKQLTGVIKSYPYRKINGTKYYKNNNQVFSMINEKKQPSNANANAITENTDAKEFYKAANEFKDKLSSGGTLYALRYLSTNDAIDENGKYYKDYEGDTNPYPQKMNIFDELFNTSGTFIEDEDSNFNMHKKQVIRNSIERNLIVAISNYNNVSTSSVNFAMPKLQDEEWEELTTNIGMITFLQGLSIGGKVYNGYSIVPNDINEDFVSEDSIYIMENKQYYRVTDEALLNGTVNLNNAIGLLNTDFERRTAVASYGNDSDENKVTKNIYYYPREDMGSYNSIITLNSNSGIDLKNASTKGISSNEYKIAQLYYTALGRERYGMYRVNNPYKSTLE